MDECIICFEETNNFVMFPCHHKVCVVCYPQLTRCPLCNQEIVLTISHQAHTSPVQLQSYISRYTSIQMVCYLIILFSILLFLFNSVPFFQYQH